MKRYLITSADERTWKCDRPVIFLGDFCRPYEKSRLWSSMDAIVAEPYGLDVEERKRDYEVVTQLKKWLFEEIYPALNEIHGVHYDQKFWLILMGDWITRYVDVIYNRVRTLEQCLSRYPISTISIKSIRDFKFSATNSLGAVGNFNDDEWNDALFAIIVKRQFSNFQIDEMETEESGRWRGAKKAGPNVVKKSIRSLAATLNKLLFAVLGRQEDALFISSYLPRSVEIKLQLKLGQVPVLWNLGYKEVEVLSSSYSHGKRAFLDSLLIRKDAESEIQSFLKDLFHLMVPIVYLEGFKELTEIVEKLPWPTRPQFIFTSNNYDFDDAFKLYAAKRKAESGSKYYIGCHGSGFFSYFENPTNAERVCDKYITWGWNHGLAQHTPGFIFTTAGRKAARQKNGKLLLVQHPLLNRVTTWDVYGEHEDYFVKQNQFVNFLSKDPRLNLVIRLHGASKNRGWCEFERWREIDAGLNIDCGDQKISQLISESRLVVFGYDSTGFAEAMALNIPVMVFLQVGFEQLNPYSRPFYSKLLDLGIAHASPETMAKKVNEVWDNVNIWWESSEIQDARELFCNGYARVSPNPVQEMSAILST